MIATRRGVGALGLALLGVMIAAAQGKAAPDELLPVGAPLPDFTLKTPDDRTLTLSEVSQDKVVLVNFYFLDNAFCRQEQAQLQKLYAKHKNQGLEIIAINAGKRDTPEAIRKRWEDAKLTFPTVKDNSADRTVAKAFHVSAFPTNYLAGKDGKILSSWIGYDPQKGADRLKVEFTRAGFK